MIRPLHKAVFVLGFASADRPGGGPVAGADDSAAVRRAVKEALAAGLKELIFVTPDSLTPVETQFGDVGNGKAERVVVARQFAAGNLGEALCGIRRSEEHTSELQSLMRISYAVFCLKKK